MAEEIKNPLLQVKDLEVSFFTNAGEVKAVRKISYDLKFGEVIGIVGESGSGKSVSSYALMGIIPEPGKVIGGDIIFDGEKILEKTEVCIGVSLRRDHSTCRGFILTQKGTV